LIGSKWTDKTKSGRELVHSLSLAENLLIRKIAVGKRRKATVMWAHSSGDPGSNVLHSYYSIENRNSIQARTATKSLPVYKKMIR
jgi:hypothetical protein